MAPPHGGEGAGESPWGLHPTPRTDLPPHDLGKALPLSGSPDSTRGHWGFLKQGAHRCQGRRGAGQASSGRREPLCPHLRLPYASFSPGGPSPGAELTILAVEEQGDALLPFSGQGQGRGLMHEPALSPEVPLTGPMAFLRQIASLQMPFQQRARRLPETEPREARPLMLGHQTPGDSTPSLAPEELSVPWVIKALCKHCTVHPQAPASPALARVCRRRIPHPEVATAQPHPRPAPHSSQAEGTVGPWRSESHVFTVVCVIVVGRGE